MKRRSLNLPESMSTITEINVTLLVDVSLVLVIIFMVTVPMLLTPLADVVLPKAVTGLEERKDVVFVSYTRAGELVLDRSTVALEQLPKLIQSRLQSSPSKTVIFRIDELTTYRHVKEVMAIAEKAGAKKLVIATELKR
jgi:biopolymer transport protein ExbD